MLPRALPRRKHQACSDRLPWGGLVQPRKTAAYYSLPSREQGCNRARIRHSMHRQNCAAQHVFKGSLRIPMRRRAMTSLIT
jgi:hypothetical protein